MTINQRILSWIFVTIEKYPWITIKYEFNDQKNIHYLNIFPAFEINNSKEYCNDENNFSLDLEYLYPNETVLFSTEDSIFNPSTNAKLYNKKILWKL